MTVEGNSASGFTSLRVWDIMTWSGRKNRNRSAKMLLLSSSNTGIGPTFSCRPTDVNGGVIVTVPGVSSDVQ